MRAFYEDLWARLPAELDPPEARRRRAHLDAHRRPADRVLDLGCGDGAFAAGHDPTRWTGADVADAALGRARERHPAARWVRVEPDGPLPFPEASFELVWCSETLEHVAATAAFLAEARRVLAPGGRLAVTVPDHPPLRRAWRALAAFERDFPPLGDHLRFYTRRSLADVLDDAGLEHVSVDRSGPLLLAAARRAGP